VNEDDYLFENFIRDQFDNGYGPNRRGNTYRMVKIELFDERGRRITQYVPLTDDDLINIGRRILGHTPSQRESYRKRWEAMDREEQRRYRPTFDPYWFESEKARTAQQEQERLRKEREEKVREAQARARAKAERDRQQENEDARRVWEKLNEEFARLKEQADRMGGPSTRQARRIRLAKIAGVEWPTEIEDKKLLRRAQRNAHPDTGGSHELWLEVDKIRVSMGL
jgi:hypothetical protein